MKTFLSYSTADQVAAERLAHLLHSRNVDVWLDRWNLVAGSRWQDEIERALRECDTCCVLIGPNGFGSWQHAEMRAAIDRQVSTGTLRVIPVLLPGGDRGERSQYPTFLTQTTWVEFRETVEDAEAVRRLLAGIRGTPPGPGSAIVADGAARPYRGLESFDAEDAQWFFGREALTDWAVDSLREGTKRGGNVRFLAVVGASGSGKSSLVRAGLVPALQRGALPSSETWPVLILKPGPSPLESLAIAVKRQASIGAAVGDVGELKTRLAQSPERLHLTIRLALDGQPATTRAVVVVDQFEEVFTLCADPAIRSAFVANLTHAATEPGGQATVIISMRADFYGKCAPYEVLAAALSDHQILVGPMSEKELREAIVGPARLAGGELEPGLTELLVDDVRNEAGGLPLLEYTLTHLWQSREGSTLTVRRYREMGGIAGALEKETNRVFDSFTAAEQDACKQIFLRLTQPGEGTEDTRRRAYRSELDQPDTEPVLEVLTKARLVVTTESEGPTREGFVEISHEALIRGWPRLRQWIQENRETLRLQTRLSDAAREWEHAPAAEKPDYLYRGARLTETEEWSTKAGAQLSPLEKQFIAASIDNRDQSIRERRNRVRFIGAIVALLITGIGATAGIGIIQYWDAQQAKVALAERAASLQNEANRTDLSGSLTVFGTPYGAKAMEKDHRGVFTSAVEKHLFSPYVSISTAINLAQRDMTTLFREQRGEVLSSMNADVFLNPRNTRRRFLALVAGWNYSRLMRLEGAVPDAQSIHVGLKSLGYDSILLVDASSDAFHQQKDALIKKANDCVKTRPIGPSSLKGTRGIILETRELKPCENVLVYVYLSGHGFVQAGDTYVVLPEFLDKEDRNLGSPYLINISKLRSELAEAAAAQVIMVDISRTVGNDKATVLR